MVEQVEFGSRDAARQIRNDPKFSAFVAESDDARESTVKLKENIPERALQDITGEAADSNAHKAEQYGQAELTREEKKRIDFSQTNVMHARSAKAIARGKGVDDWLSFYDPELEVDEQRGRFEQAKQDEIGRSGLGRDQASDEVIDQRQARAHHQVQEHELDTAKGHAFQGDRDAQGFVQEQAEAPDSGFGDVFDMSFQRTDDGTLRGSGRDFERLQEHHEDRPPRARTLDEKMTAQPTRDPFEWMNDPRRWDYPGIDTVQPAELHGQRSKHAQALDERDVAPMAPTKQAWAFAPGRFDWQGVDDVNPEAFHASRSQRARTIDEKEIAPQADSKQQWAQNPDRWDWQKIDAPDSYGPFANAETPAPERNTEAPEPFVTELLQQDVSLAPEEAFEGVGSGSQALSATATPFGLAGGQEADEAFIQAEEQRAAGGIDETGGMGFVDDRDRQGSLAGFGMETDGTVHRESREAVEQASEFGVDDRSDPSRGPSSGGGGGGGIQEGLAGYGDEDDQEGGLFGY